MKQYDVKISRMALSDMEQIYNYIADRLLEPDTAMGQYNRIHDRNRISLIKNYWIRKEYCNLGCYKS